MTVVLDALQAQSLLLRGIIEKAMIVPSDNNNYGNALSKWDYDLRITIFHLHHNYKPITIIISNVIFITYYIVYCIHWCEA